MPEKEIRNVFSKHPEVIYGFTEISYSPYAESYASALVFAVPYGEQLSPDDYTEERFEQGIQSARTRLEHIVSEIEGVLQDGPHTPDLGGKANTTEMGKAIAARL